MKLILALGLAVALLLIPLATGKKKKKDDVTQVLEVPPDPPPAVAAETRRLVFQTSPLMNKGLLSQQTRDALHEILRRNGGMPIVKIRAFVAGTGDLRRVPQIVSEIFTEKKHLQLPAVSVVLAGGLPLEGAQVVLEVVSVSKRDVNPQGLVFVAGRDHSVDQSLQPLAPLAEAALADLTDRLAGREALRVTCFVTMLDDAAKISAAMTARFPWAALDLVQTRRAASRSAVACEAVAQAVPVPSAGTAGLTFVNSDQVVLTGTQVAYGFSDDDARLAFQRLDKVLAPYGASARTAAMLNLYPLSWSIASQASRLRIEFTDPAHLPVTTALPFEGLPGMDSSFAIEAVAPATTVPASVINR
jgi:enamine deaminase RidA (YjgF/YER057c/UK114 family)